jgi:cob(I)alamin adenosyltransferase
MLYTRKGDGGTTKLFNCPQGVRLSKSQIIFEALGTVDELNCAIGFARSLALKSGDTLIVSLETKSYAMILERLQNMLFVIQAELGGSETSTKKESVDFEEQIVASVEEVLPPITTFIVPGGTEVGAYLDVCRTIARRAERIVIKAHEDDSYPVSAETLMFLNRLSSVLYALARWANHQRGVEEKSPSYT